jgi:hypothetical protein
MTNISILATEHNPHITLPEGVTRPGALSWVLLLKGVCFQFGDVDAGYNVGHIVIGPSCGAGTKYREDT